LPKSAHKINLANSRAPPKQLPPINEVEEESTGKKKPFKKQTVPLPLPLPPKEANAMSESNLSDSPEKRSD
jgi:hypothetical protein